MKAWKGKRREERQKIINRIQLHGNNGRAQTQTSQNLKGRQKPSHNARHTLHSTQHGPRGPGQGWKNGWQANWSLGDGSEPEIRTQTNMMNMMNKTAARTRPGRDRAEARKAVKTQKRRDSKFKIRSGLGR